MDIFRACLKKIRVWPFYKGHGPGACPSKMFSWSPGRN